MAASGAQQISDRLADPVRIGVVGAGMVSEVYLENLGRFKNVRVVACSDLDLDRARSRAKQFSIPLVASVDEVISHPDIELVLNLTTPDAHFEIAQAAVTAGKSVYNEKPLCVEYTDAGTLLETAAATGVLVGAAPDSFFGSMHQTTRELVDAGGIGRPVTAIVSMHGPGHERWHPNAAFYYRRGGGPLYDFGPYCVSALVNLFGPVLGVSGVKSEDRSDRVQKAGPDAGRQIPVEIPTHVSGLLEFGGGIVASLLATFGVWGTLDRGLEVLGTEGSLILPSPQLFGGEIQVLEAETRTWSVVSQRRPYATRFRGIGVADMAVGMRSGRPHRASGELALHVLEVLHALEQSSENGRRMQIETSCARPASLPADLEDGQLD